MLFQGTQVQWLTSSSSQLPVPPVPGDEACGSVVVLTWHFQGPKSVPSTGEQWDSSAYQPSLRRSASHIQDKWKKTKHSNLGQAGVRFGMLRHGDWVDRERLESAALGGDMGRIREGLMLQHRITRIRWQWEEKEGQSKNKRLELKPQLGLNPSSSTFSLCELGLVTKLHFSDGACERLNE